MKEYFLIKNKKVMSLCILFIMIFKEALKSYVNI